MLKYKVNLNFCYTGITLKPFLLLSLGQSITWH